MIREIPGSIDEVDTPWVSRLVERSDIEGIRKTRIGEGFGLAAKTYRVDVVSPGSIAPLAIKLCDAETAVAEAHVYTHVLSDTAICHPVLLDSGANDTDGVVVYEFAEGATQGDVLAGCSEAMVRAIIANLVDLHASWWNKASGARIRTAESWMRRPLTLAHVADCLARHSALLDAEAVDLIRSLPGRIDVIVDELMEHPITVVHADAHLDNVLFLEDGNPMLLDWSTARVGPAAIDVAHCQVECLTAHQRRNIGGEMIRYHHQALVARGVDDYTLGELQRATDLAQLAFIPGVVRWGAAGRAEGHPGRADRLFRSLLVATTDAALGR
jgi:hypothetical protein